MPSAKVLVLCHDNGYVAGDLKYLQELAHSGGFAVTLPSLWKVRDGESVNPILIFTARRGNAKTRSSDCTRNNTGPLIAEIGQALRTAAPNSTPRRCSPTGGKAKVHRKTSRHNNENEQSCLAELADERARGVVFVVKRPGRSVQRMHLGHRMSHFKGSGQPLR